MKYVIMFPHDDSYLLSYDPNAHAPGRPHPTGDVVVTKYIEKAMKFDKREDAFALWKTQSTAVPLRLDGKPNRPLTAFTITVEPYHPDKAKQ